MESYELLEAVPNFSEGRDAGVIDAIVSAARAAHHLDTDSDADHNRMVLSLAGGPGALLDALFAAVAVAVERIDLRHHSGVHPRVGAADVVPLVPLGSTTLERCRSLASELGERIWRELRVPVYLYREGRTLADIRSGRVKPDLGGPSHHPTAGAVCVGARMPLVAFNIILPATDPAGARAIARGLRESAGGIRGVQALAFVLSGERVQLSTNLFRLEETSPQAVLDELRRRGVTLDAQQVVGLCPAFAANPAADGRLLEARTAAAAARSGADACRERGGEELSALASRLEVEAASLAALSSQQEDILIGAERASALAKVLRAARVLDMELAEMLTVSAQGLRRAIAPQTVKRFRARLEAFDRQSQRDPP